MNCRFDQTPMEETVLDLGFSPPSNAFLTSDQLQKPETHLPLKLCLNPNNFLLQLVESEQADKIFNEDYAYFSSFSSSWLRHAKTYVEQAVESLGLGENSFVVEVASNDGYLLQNFLPLNIPCLGIDPSANVAEAAQEKGIETLVAFFGEATAEKVVASHGQADLIAANNVFAHVPNINDFTSGFAKLLKPEGTLTIEFPHLLKLLQESQFDTIYHEHYFYYSLHSAQSILAKQGLEVYKVQELTTHGGSLRLWVQHTDTGKRVRENSVDSILQAEVAAGILQKDTYLALQERVAKIKIDLLSFLIENKKAGKKVAGYGAAAKGNTLLNFCAVKPDLLSFVADKNPHKQGRYCPGSHIPVLAPERIFEEKPDFLIIFPWNLKDEIIEEWKEIREWGGKFVIPLPTLEII